MQDNLVKIRPSLWLAFALLSAILLNGCGGGSNGGSSAPVSNGLAQIQAQMNSFTNLFAAGLPGLTVASAYLDTADSNFKMDGMSAAIYAKQLTTAPAPLASGDYFLLTLAGVFDNTSQNNNAADTQWVDAIQFNASGVTLGRSRVKFKNVGGTWLIDGNERAVQVNFRAESAMTSAIAATGTTPAVAATFSSDVNISIDPTTAALSGVASAWVSSPSILSSSPSGFLVYSNSAPATPASAVQTSQIFLCDSTITNNCTNALDGSVYTITLKDNTGAVIATYNEVLNKAPLPASALDTTMFPSIGAITIAGGTPGAITDVTPNAALGLSWANPTGLVSNWVDFTVWDSNGQLVLQLSGPPSGNSFSGIFPAFAPPASGVVLSKFGVTVEASDVYGRQYVVFK